MRRAGSLALAALAALLGLAACGDNLQGPSDAPPSDAAVDSPDAPPDAPPAATGACLDRPTELDRPPTGTLPCELLPPGLTL